MAGSPVGNANDLLHFVDGSLVYAGRHAHDPGHHLHTHSFVEVAVVVGGEGRHVSLAGRQPVTVGDVVLLRPGVWHGYADCRRLEVFNCCISVELLHRELAWTRADQLLGYLLWTGPYSLQRRGMLSTRLGDDILAECVTHLDALHALRFRSADRHRGDIVGRLSLFLSALARTVDPASETAGPTHPAVVAAMRLLESRPAHHWTLRELAELLHLAPGYLVRLFKGATGLPPMAYLSRLRVELAATRLLHTDHSIAHIARSVGWPDQNYFARRFKVHYGLSASGYRARFTDNTIALDVVRSKGLLR
ncbi:AraC family transcriptional regulator [Actinophytocola sediminis]